MLPNLQFTDFHKFLVSAGGLACVASGALPFLLLRTQKTVSATTKQLGELSPDARSATEVQQSQLLWLLKVWPWISGALLIMGLALIVFGAIQWQKRQSVLDSKEAAEIAKLQSEREKADAEREKVYQESVALSRANQESPAEAGKSLEEKATESLDRENAPLSESEVEGDRSGAEPINEEPRDDATISALRTIMDASEDLPAEARGYIATLSAIELTFQAIRRSLPNASIVRNVRLGRTRADAIVTSRDLDRYDLAIDIRRLNGSARDARWAVEKVRGWGDAVGMTPHPVHGKHYRPVSILILPDQPSWQPPGKQLDQFVSFLQEPGLKFSGNAPMMIGVLSPSIIQEENVTFDFLKELPPETSQTEVILAAGGSMSLVQTIRDS